LAWWFKFFGERGGFVVRNIGFAYSPFRRQIPVYPPYSGEIRESRRSGGFFPYSRRDPASTVALLVSPADIFAKKFVIQQRSSCFPPANSAAIFTSPPTLMEIVI
jgi:hypothetical protein